MEEAGGSQALTFTFIRLPWRIRPRGGRGQDRAPRARAVGVRAASRRSVPLPGLVEGGAVLAPGAGSALRLGLRFAVGNVG